EGNEREERKETRSVQPPCLPPCKVVQAKAGLLHVYATCSRLRPGHFSVSPIQGRSCTCAVSNRSRPHRTLRAAVCDSVDRSRCSHGRACHRRGKHNVIFSRWRLCLSA